MRVCPVCGRLYPLEAAFCQADGQRLGPASKVPRRSDTTDPRIGELLLGRFMIFRTVADGGTGRVYEALDQQELRHVALKVLHPDVASDAVSVERFCREYEVSSELPHEHIVEVLDFQPLPAGGFALVMEFLVGEELRSTLKREGRLSVARTLRLLCQLALGLDPAHNLGFVHRDLKPDNIFLCQTREGDVVKVFDFGSVKDRSSRKQLTVMGTTIGSPYYMSPEQAQGLKTLDHRADVWAVAAVAYEALSGSLPFKGANAPSILLEILSKAPERLSLQAAANGVTLPPALDAVIIAGLDKEPLHRTPSVGALADACGAALGLSGDHREWAQLSEKRLQRSIAEALSRGTLRSRSDSFGGFFRQELAAPLESIEPAPKRAFAPQWLVAIVVVLGLLGALGYALQ